MRIREPARAITYEEDALRIATKMADAVLQAVARFRLGYLLSYAGQRERGLRLQLDSLTVLDALPPDALARVVPLDFVCADFTGRHSSVKSAQAGRFHEAESRACEALSRVDGALVPLSQDAWMALAIVDRVMGRPEAGWQRAIEISAAFRSYREHDIATWVLGAPLLWMALVYRTDDPAALQTMRAMLDAHPPQPGEIFAILPIQVLHMSLLYIGGAWVEARQIMAAVRRSPRVRHPYTDGAWLIHALIAVAQGDHETAWALVREEFVMGATTEPGNHRYDISVYFQRIAVMLALDAGDLPTAREWLQAHDRWLAWSGTTLGRADAHLLWARYARSSGDHAAAVMRATQACCIAAHEPRQPLALLAAHRLLGELHMASRQFGEAENHLRTAGALADACQSLYERGLTLLASAELHDATGDVTDALALLDEAREMHAPLGARPALARASALAARLTPDTDAPDSDRDSPSLPDGLTLREAEVLRTLAAGLSNREIAATLHLSIRTVERHINNVYTKIGAHGRAEGNRVRLPQGPRLDGT